MASDETNAYIVGSTLEPNTISSITATAVDNVYVGTVTAITLTFTPDTGQPAANYIEIQFPTSVENFGFDDGTCTLTYPLSNAVASPTSCTITNNLVQIEDLNGGSTVSAGSQI